MKYLLDTNICVGFLNGNPGVQHRVLSTPRGYLSISTLTEAELLFGAERSGRVEANRNRVTTFLREIEVLPFDRVVARQFGVTKSDLLARGKPIPDFDIGIAATALVTDAVLVSIDRHMLEIRELMLENWIS